MFKVALGILHLMSLTRSPFRILTLPIHTLVQLRAFLQLPMLLAKASEGKVTV
jgi:hypothetical protein